MVHTGHPHWFRAGQRGLEDNWAMEKNQLERARRIFPTKLMVLLQRAL